MPTTVRGRQSEVLKVGMCSWNQEDAVCPSDNKSNLSAL